MRLRRANPSDRGILRRRHGRGFAYVYSDGAKVTDPETLLRIKQLAIPPAWNDVWICAYPNGHLQAVGLDAAGRKQYLYHERWRRSQDRAKFDRMLDFARRLPRVRAECARRLDADGLGRERVLACAVRLLDRGFFRVGGEDYAEQNQTYGLATIRKDHVRLRPNYELEFDFIAKGGKDVFRSIVDPPVYDVIAALKRRRSAGSELLAYKEDRRWRDLRSDEINQFIKELTGGDFSAKDFRTWNATVLAATGIAVTGQAATSRSGRKRAIALVVNDVARYLDNTPAIARSSYIDPRVWDRYESGWTISGALESLGRDADLGAPSIQGAIEEAVTDLLEDNRDSRYVEPSDALDAVALSA